jgi:hypothetical protein
MKFGVCFALRCWIFPAHAIAVEQTSPPLSLSLQQPPNHHFTTPNPKPHKYQEFDERELVLRSKLSSKAAEAADLQSRLADLDRQLDDKRAEAEGLAAARAAAVAAFEGFVADKRPFVEALTRIFHRCVAGVGMGWSMATGSCWTLGIHREQVSCQPSRGLEGCRGIWRPWITADDAQRPRRKVKRAANRGPGGLLGDNDSDDDDDDDDLLGNVRGRVGCGLWLCLGGLVLGWAASSPHQLCICVPSKSAHLYPSISRQPDDAASDDEDGGEDGPEVCPPGGLVEGGSGISRVFVGGTHRVDV